MQPNEGEEDKDANMFEKKPSAAQANDHYNADP